MSTHAADVQDILRQAAILVGKAEAAGVTLRITGKPMLPLAMGNQRTVIDAWPARHGAQPAASIGRGSGAAPRREISDREWAARDPSLREGSTVRVPGVGEL